VSLFSPIIFSVQYSLFFGVMGDGIESIDTRVHSRSTTFRGHSQWIMMSVGLGAWKEPSSPRWDCGARRGSKSKNASLYPYSLSSPPPPRMLERDHKDERWKVKLPAAAASLHASPARYLYLLRRATKSNNNNAFIMVTTSLLFFMNFY
jgi:hypothetical protein